MSHLAFRRDTSDERLILDFVAQVGSPEVLQLLYVLTCADLAAVGTHDRSPSVEEPDEAKVSRPVLEPGGGGDPVAQVN